MIPQKRGSDAGEVQDLHNKVPRAAATSQEEPEQEQKQQQQEKLDEMAGRAPEIDEDLHSRQLAVYGRETMKRLFGSNVLVSGLQGLGAEIAKNLALAGVKSVTLHDDGKVELWDLSSNFFLSEKDVGQNRAQSCVPKLQELNNAVIISTLTGDLTKEQLSNFQAVVFTDISLDKAVEFDDYCHNHQPPIAFIKSEVRGLFGSVFCDFGPEFTVLDVDGEEPHTGIVASISNDNPALVSCVDDERLEFQDGDLVSFSEVMGMPELNDGRPRKIKNARPFSFTLEEDTSSYGTYIRGGIVTQVKPPKILKFKPLKEAIKEPGEFLMSDFSKFDRPPLLHLAFQALDKFRNELSRFPVAGSADDAQKLIDFAVTINESLGDSKLEEVDKKLLHHFASGSKAVLNPMAAMFGGIVGQEVVKACSGKFHPLYQFFYFDSVESLPVEPLEPSDLKPENGRYDAQISVFGAKLQNKLEQAKLFMVGSGALGCEFLKNFALMGISCSPNGKLTVTDDDVIEKSNLSRQFLFRDWNIGQPKSTVAATAAMAINPKLHVEALQNRASPETENVFNDAFWESLDAVVNALDNVTARMYIDSRCVYFQKPLLESGTLGAKCNTQMVIPHLTENYGASRDPPEKQAPMCTVHSFPHNIDHCLTWARSEFEGLLEKTPTEVNAFLSNPSGYATAARTAGDAQARDQLERVIECLDREKCETFQDCITWTRLKFEDYFSNRVKQLTYTFPEDAMTSSGAPFWSAPKRFPRPLEFSSSDPSHLNFLLAGSILRAETFGIPIPDWVKDQKKLAEAVDKVIVPDFQPKQGVKIETDEKATSLSSASVDDAAVIEELIAKLEAISKTLQPGFHMNPIQFEKDDDTNFHMDLIAGFANFEALTPNLLARTIETVEGGGLIIMMLRSLSSLTSLYTMVMDVHERFRTESHSQAAARFNERFLLSIASCKACVVMDDELNILPISSHMKFIQPVTNNEDSEGLSERERELKDLKDQFREDFPVGPLIGKCCTMDQGKAVVNFLDSILDKSLRSTVALLAARGRGKSAALGLAIAGAIAAGYSNIFVTAPSPENLKTLFDFVCKGINALEYKEHLHYDVVKSADPELRKATIQINVFKQHRQTIQYLKPHDHGKLSQVELLVIDEAAAIPLPIVKSMLGPYLVFLSSTVNGYEGTGRSLSLKLIQQLECQSQPSVQSNASNSSRLFKKIELNESIRYASGDPIETWLNDLLCLDLANSIPNISRLPHPKECDLYYVNRDTLFSYHKESEIFLQRMMALYVASHYKNSPNDLQLMADAPAHHLFVLLGPVDESKNQLPDILCVIQVCLEGQISRKSAMKSLSEGRSPSGDQIPWKFCEQFQDNVFPSLSGARIVRIAVHPSALRLGYGSAAVDLLTRYYEGQMTLFADDEEETEEPEVKITEAAEKASLLEENVKPRANLPPLLVHLRERRPERLHYLGVSFGLTQELFRFWRKHNFYPFYVGQIQSAVTGEHTCMVLRPLNSPDIEVNESSKCGFLDPFYQDFRQRFRRLLGTSFRHLNFKLAMSVLASKIDFSDHETSENDKNCTSKLLGDMLSPHDMKRLEAYSNNLVDYHLILDLVPILAHQYFSEKLPVSLHGAQAAVLFCMGLQDKDIGTVKEELGIEREQVLSNFIKTMKKLYGFLHKVAGKEIEATLPRLKEIEMAPLSKSMDDDLAEAAKEVEEQRRAANEAAVDPKLLQKYAIDDDDNEIVKALQNGKVSASGVISVKSNKTRADKKEKHKEMGKSKRKGTDGGRSESKKKRS